MSKISWKNLKAFMAAIILVGGTVTATATMSPAAAQGNPTLGPTVARELTKAFEIIQATPDPTDADYRAALAIMEALIRDRGGNMSPYERATTYELIGSYKSQLNPPDYTAALRAFESALAEPNALPIQRERQIRYFVAQLYFQQERYPEAIRFLREYIDFQNSQGAAINANTYYLLAAAYVATDNYSGAREPMENALRLHEKAVTEAGTRRSKSYYDLLNSVYSQLSISDRRSALLEKMINYWPAEASYWEQLSGLYSQADRGSDAAAVLELAYKNGLIKDENRIINLVQYYSLLENPYRGAKLLEREMAAGNVQRSQKNLELLAQMWNLAREQKKAAAALEEAAKIAPTGELYYRLGQVYFADEQYTKAEQSLTQAINRGGISAKARGNIWLLIGNARYNLDTNSATQRARAMEAWRNVATTTGASQQDRTAASGWIQYVRAVEQTTCNQDRVERLVRVDNYKKDKTNCETNLDIIKRTGNDFATSLSATRIAECEKVVVSSIDQVTAIITYADGTTDGTPVPGFCSKY